MGLILESPIDGNLQDFKRYIRPYESPFVAVEKGAGAKQSLARTHTHNPFAYFKTTDIWLSIHLFVCHAVEFVGTTTRAHALSALRTRLSLRRGNIARTSSRYKR